MTNSLARKQKRQAGQEDPEATVKKKLAIYAFAYSGAGPVVPACKSGLVLAAGWGCTTAPRALLILDLLLQEDPRRRRVVRLGAGLRRRGNSNCLPKCCGREARGIALGIAAESPQTDEA